MEHNNNSNHDWDWNKLMRSYDYNTLAIDEWPGWDKTTIKKNKYSFQEPYHVKFECCLQDDISQSRQIAIEFDDISDGSFWYRDFTESSIPIVNKGEMYWSMFVFQFKSDYELFLDLYPNLNYIDEITR